MLCRAHVQILWKAKTISRRSRQTFLNILFPSPLVSHTQILHQDICAAAKLGINVLLYQDPDHFLESINKNTEILENKLFENSRESTIDDVLTQKKILIKLKNVFFHQEEVIHKLGYNKYKNICDQCVPYFRNVEDHMRRIGDLAEMNLDTMRGLIDASFSLSSHRLGDIMRVLTVFAAILLPLSVIVGIFGMNFKNIPGLDKPWGFPIVMLFMATVATALLIYFKKNKWL